MNELHDNKFNALITASLCHNVTKEADAFLSLDVSGIPDQARIKNRILKKAEKLHRSLLGVRLRIVAVACLVAITLTLMACVCIPEIRKAVWNAMVTWNNGYIGIGFTPNDTESQSTTEPKSNDSVPNTQAFPSRIETMANTTYLPQGYRCTQTKSTPYLVQSHYSDASDNLAFTMTQRVYDPEAAKDFMVDSDEALVSTVTIGLFEGVLVQYYDTPGLCLLTWLNRSYLYTLYGYFDSTDELLKIAEGIQAEPPATPPQRIELLAKASDLPDGYQCRGGFQRTEVDGSLIQVDSFYYASSGKKMFQLSQSVIDPNQTVDYNGDFVSTVTVNDYEGVMVVNFDTPNHYLLVWQDDSYQYTLTGQFHSNDELMMIAEGIQIE